MYVYDDGYVFLYILVIMDCLIFFLEICQWQMSFLSQLSMEMWYNWFMELLVAFLIGQVVEVLIMFG